MEPAVPGFEVVKKLGGGSVAEVFLIRSGMTQQQQVMKVLRPELMSDAAVMGRFLDEAKLCEALDHPHIVKHLGVSRTQSGQLYILTRYLEGEDLAHHLRERGPVSPPDWVALATRLCDALSYIHARGIIHRDLKPSNVFLAGGLAAHRPVLIDFGVAHSDGKRRVHTEAGIILTTPEYTAPELIQGGTPDPRTDIYAFGILMFESLVGHPPFVDKSPQRVFQMHLEAPLSPLPANAAALEMVLLRCLAKRPEDRFSSAAQLSDALREANALLEATERATIPPSGRRTEPTSLAVSPGDVLGSYRVERLLGEGGMGRVFLATHIKLGRHVALKVLRFELAARKEGVERFFQEARAVNQINHEHIVEVHDFVEERAPGGDARVYCIMELLGGKTLRGLLDEGPIPLQRMIGITRQICDALAAAHRLGIVHRDIKPENIFLTQRSGIQDFVKVLDFGMAKFQLTESSGERSTLQGMIVGTPDYMAPEQANGLATDVRTDVYALGLLLYEMLCGRVPFSSPAVMPLLMKIARDPPPPLAPANLAGEVIPDALRNLVMKCLAKAAADRPQSVDEMTAVLEAEATAGVLAAETSGSHRPAEAPPPAPSPRLWIAAGAGLAALVGAGVAIASLRDPPPPPQVATTRPAEPLPAPPVARRATTIRLALSSVPAGASVRRADTGEDLGKTPLSRQVPLLAGGEVSLRFEMAGFQPADERVRWDRDVTLDVTLAPEHAHPALPKSRPASSRTSRRPSKDDLVDPLSP